MVHGDCSAPPTIISGDNLSDMDYLTNFGAQFCKEQKIREVGEV